MVPLQHFLGARDHTYLVHLDSIEYQSAPDALAIMVALVCWVDDAVSPLLSKSSWGPPPLSFVRSSLLFVQKEANPAHCSHRFHQSLLPGWIPADFLPHSLGGTRRLYKRLFRIIFPLETFMSSIRFSQVIGSCRNPPGNLSVSG